MKYVFTILSGYLIGSVSISILLSRTLFGTDIRQAGSGNAGATNAARVFGWWAGLVTFGGDFAKAYLSLWLGNLLLGDIGIALAAVACLLGHCFPLYYHFRGGKAVSVGAAVAFCLDWHLFCLVLVVFLAVALSTRLVSLASICAAVSMGIAAPLLCPGICSVLPSEFAVVLLIFMHRSNIGRLLRHEEPRFTPGHRKKG